MNVYAGVFICIDGELTYRYEKEDHAAEGEATGVA